MTGLKPKWLELINLLDIKGFGDPSYFVYKLREIYQILEDVYSVGSMVELQEAIDGIGDGAGTIFIEAGTHVIDTPIDVDGGGSLVIYGHGDNTVLEVVDGISAFNITDCASLTIKNLQIDATNYTGATSGIIVNETNDNVITIEDVTIIGNNIGRGIELRSENCFIENCNISLMNDGIYINNSNRHRIAQNILSNNARYGIYLDTVLYSNINNNTCNLNLSGIYMLDGTGNSFNDNTVQTNIQNGMHIRGVGNNLSGNICENNTGDGMYIYGSYNTLIGNVCNTNTIHGIEIDQSSYGTIVGNSCNNNVASGILIYNCTTIAITGNECYNNCEGHAFNAGGINLAPNADYCTVSGNVCGNNTNTTGGVDGYGIRVQAASCENNIISSNVLYGNDIDFINNGTGTVIIQGGWSGWVDDGINFRITVVDGMITGVANSTAGGHNP